MASVTGLTKERMEAIEDASVVSGEIDIDGHLILTTFGGDEIDAGSALPALPTASDTVAGIVELATNAETITGSDTVRAVTPAGLAAAVSTLVPDATDTVKGKVELATNAETVTGTDTVRATTPAGVKAHVDAAISAASVPDASETVKGKVELATNAEAVTGTDTVRAVTPAGLKAHVDAFPAASTTVQGKVELATTAETTTGTDTDRAVTPAALKGSVAAIGIVGEIRMYAGVTAPTGWLFCDGSSVSRSTYADLFAVIVQSKGTFTVTIATPGVVTFNTHGYTGGEKIYFTTTGALPTGLSINTTYFVLAASLTTNTFRVSATDGGAAINTSGSQSGVHTMWNAPYGIAAGSSTNFNLPNLTGRSPMAPGSSGTAGTTTHVLGQSSGEEKHTLTTGELPPHTHLIGRDSDAQLGSNEFVLHSAGVSGAESTVATGDGGFANTAMNNLPPYLGVNFIIKT